jgi:DNA-binding IclR family transcriptional regulator
MAQGNGARRGIQSIEVGGALLKALAHHGRALPLKELAAEAGMVPAKAHPYLVSFGKLGLIEQDGVSGHYGLGPLAMQLGLISLQQLDPVALASARLEALAATIGHTVAIAVWGGSGATIVRVARPATAVYVSMRHGTVMSLRGTASGLLFAAFLPREQVLPVLKAEAGAGTGAGNAGRTRARMGPELTARLARIRREGLAVVKDLLLPGVSALARPVLDARGVMTLALTAIGPTAVFDSRREGSVAKALGEAASELSLRLGRRGAF